MNKEKILQLIEELKKEINKDDNIVDNSINNVRSNSVLRDLIVSEALKFNQLGVYKLGGEGYENILTTGVDCSGFVYSIFNHCGIKIDRLASYQYATLGKDKTVPEPGDLIFYKNDKTGKINHVAIYIGDGKIINHGSTPTKILDWQYRPVVKIKDLIGDK